MPDTFWAVLELDGLIWLIAATFLAGTVRGFAGFGTSLVYLPFASQFIEPVWAVITVAVFDIVGPLMLLPRALRDGHPRDMIRLSVGALVGLPIGLAVLFVVSPDVFRYAVSALSAAMLIALVLGLRYHATLTKPMIFGTGALSGFLGGAAGIPGPPVILIYMARSLPAQVVRANITAYLLFYDLMLLGYLALSGHFLITPVILGLVLTLPNALGNLAGAAIFRPEWEKGYRVVAYLIIAGSALSGLPLLD